MSSVSAERMYLRVSKA